jgi:hypothetical protein
MSGMPWPLYHAYAHDDWSTVWEWIDAGGDEERWLDRTEIAITVTLPAYVLIHTDLIIKWVKDNYYTGFDEYYLRNEELSTRGWINPVTVYNNIYKYVDIDDEGVEWYRFSFNVMTWWFTWKDMSDTALEQLRDMRQDTGIGERAWDEDAVSEIEVL